MFRIIALEREFGCGGGGIAADLAHRLGWKLWDQQLTCEIAKRAQVSEHAVALCDERVDSRLYRLAEDLLARQLRAQPAARRLLLRSTPTA